MKTGIVFKGDYVEITGQLGKVRLIYSPKSWSDMLGDFIEPYITMDKMVNGDWVSIIGYNPETQEEGSVDISNTIIKARMISGYSGSYYRIFKHFKNLQN